MTTKNIRAEMRREAEARENDDRPSLSDCIAEANFHDREVRGCRSSMLESARLAGQALIHAKSHLKKQTPRRWTVFLKENFQGSPESARGYMRIAEHWDGEALTAARRSPNIPKSITAVLKIIREDKPPRPERAEIYQSADEISLKWDKKMLWESLRDRVKALTYFEVKGLMACGVDTCWDKFLEEAKRIRRLHKEGQWPPAEEPNENDPDVIAHQALRERRKKRRRSQSSSRNRAYS